MKSLDASRFETYNLEEYHFKPCRFCFHFRKVLVITRNLLFLVATITLIFHSVEVSAKDSGGIGKVDLFLGAYNLKAKTSTSDGSLSGFGSYKLGIRRTLTSQFEFGASYTLFTSEISGGDLGFGPDLNVFYYPISPASPVSFTEDGYNIFLTEFWRPFVFLGFHQRNFQSLDASYAGFGGGGGVEFTLSRKFALRTEVRYMSMFGPNKSTAQMFDLSLGLSFLF